MCGIVKDEESRPVAGARVIMADVGIGVVTDRTGRFCMTAPVGVRTVSVMAMGFTTWRDVVSVSKSTPELQVTLKSPPSSPDAATPH
jgi:hypothetical protein